MASEHELRKKRYRNEILAYLHDPSERRARKAKTEPAVRFGRFGRYGPAPEPSETQRAFMSGLYDGLSFSAADEISAASEAIPAWFDDRDAGQVYDDELERVRAEAAYLQAQHPIAYGGGQVVGTLAQPFNYTGVGWAGRGATLAMQAARGAAVGGANGAVHGFAGGEGGFGNRFASGAKDAAIGALTGGALPVAGHFATEPATTAMARSVVAADAEVPLVKQFIRNMQYGRDDGVDWANLPAHVRDLMVARNGSALQNRAKILRDAEFDTIPQGGHVVERGKTYYRRTDGFIPKDEVETLMNGWVGRSKTVSQIGKNKDVPQFVSGDATQMRRARGTAHKKRSPYALTGYQTNLERKLHPSDTHYGLNAHVNVR
jgi:hypothetical protein